MTLREATRQRHEEAENHRFVKALFGGNLPFKAYAEFLYNQMFAYRALELAAKEAGVLEGISEIQRTKKIKEDLTALGELDPNLYPLKLHKSTHDYIQYVLGLQQADDLMAHVYVRHMGDMFGGAMIKKVIAGPGHMYEFENRGALIQEIRSRLKSEMADEANRVFEFAIRLFEEIANEHDL